MTPNAPPLTRKEVESWPPVGPMALKAERVFALLDRLEAAEAERDRLQDDRNLEKLMRKDAEAAREEACAELEDFRRAWAILDEPGETLRHAHTATETATQFRARLDAARAEAADWRQRFESLMGLARQFNVDPDELPRLRVEVEKLRADVARLMTENERLKNGH
jgi:hypothetical protein